MNYPDTNIQLLTLLEGIAKRPYMYVASRKEFLALMWGYVVGRVNGVPVPGPNFKEFEVGLDEPPTREWAEPVVKYVQELLGDRA